jgi:hypothetical protein
MGQIKRQSVILDLLVDSGALSLCQRERRTKRRVGGPFLREGFLSNSHTLPYEGDMGSPSCLYTHRSN